MPRPTALRVGTLIYDGVDQLDVTGPLEVLAKVPGAECRLYGVGREPVRDIGGLRLLPDGTLEDALPLDVLHVPGGLGQEDLMTDRRVLSWIAGQAGHARLVLSVCTGALICGAAGLLHGRRATTHWSVRHLLPLFGAIVVDERVVDDHDMIFAAGVTSGIDGALLAAERLAGGDVARSIQLAIEYAPSPPFDAGTPERAPGAIVDRVRRASEGITARREASARSYRASVDDRPRIS